MEMNRGTTHQLSRPQCIQNYNTGKELHRTLFCLSLRFFWESHLVPCTANAYRRVPHDLINIVEHFVRKRIQAGNRCYYANKKKLLSNKQTFKL